MNFDAFKREVLSRYVSMASDPAWKAYAWDRVNEMARDFPHQFGDLPEMLKAEMNKEKGSE